MLHLLWLVPAVGVLLFLAQRSARRAILRLTALRDRLAPVDDGRRAAGAALFLVAISLIAVALARPGWDPRPMVVHQAGRDVVFVVDVSFSMLAEDVAPGRLERAKHAMLDAIPALDGDRVALVAFAGSTSIVCPLTRDYGFFRWAVEGLSTGSAETDGTLIGDAIRKVTVDVFDPREKRYKDLILLSDGEDQDSFPTQAAEAAGAQGVRIIAIGIGDEAQGARIPLADASGSRTYLTWQGQEVVSRMQSGTLRDVALATPGGRYLNAATGSFDLGGIYRQLIAGEMKRDLGPVEITRYPEKFQIFLLAALTLLAAETALGERKRRARRSSAGRSGA
jgi:hypothetical protein